MTTDVEAHDLRPLFTKHLAAEDFDGELALPGHPTWAEARRAFQLAVDQQPLAVVAARSVDDVVATVRAAAAAGVRVAPQSTGHNAGPMGALDDTVLLRTAELRGVEIDPERRVARVGAGVVWQEVADAAAEHGLAALAGSSPNVGVAGYTLGGGLSWLARAHGLASQHLVAAEVVTADGRARRVDAEHDPALFWALRGGGGSFAVVTALEIGLLPITEVVAGALMWPIERAAQVMHAWRDWTTDVPEAVTSVGRVLRFPPLPELPEFLRGRELVVLEVISLLDRDATDDLVAALRALQPEIDTIAPTAARDLGSLHMDPTEPVFAAADGVALADLPREALDAWLEQVGPTSGSPLLGAELRHAGGAAAHGARPGGARPGLHARFLSVGAGMGPDAASLAGARQALVGLEAALAPWRTVGYGNFSETPRPVADLFDPETYARLRTVKTAYDPDDLVRANQPIPPAPRAASGGIREDA